MASSLATSLMIAAFGLGACATMDADAAPKKAVGEVSRVNENKILVTQFMDRDEGGNVTFEVLSDQPNFQAYLDMVGQDIKVGEIRPIPYSIGRIIMTADRSLIIQISPDSDHGVIGVSSTLSSSDPRYDGLLAKYSTIKPGHFALITRVSDISVK